MQTFYGTMSYNIATVLKRTSELPDNFNEE